MKALLNPKLEELAEAALDIHGVDGVQIECNSTTLWVNVNGLCVLRIGGLQVLEINGTEYEMKLPRLSPDNMTDDEECVADEKIQEEPELDEEEFHHWEVRNATHGAFVEFDTEKEALAFVPSDRCPKQYHPFEIWYKYRPGTRGITRARHRWDRISKQWNAVTFGSRKRASKTSKKRTSRKF